MDPNRGAAGNPGGGGGGGGAGSYGNGMATTTTTFHAMNAMNAMNSVNPALLEIKKLSRFYAEDKPPKKRMQSALEVLRTGDALQTATFWDDLSSVIMLLTVVWSYIGELETAYIPQQDLISRIRKRNFSTEDWTEAFEILEMIVRNSRPRIRTGWHHILYLQLFQKLLLAENMPYLKKYAFRCLALYADILQNHEIDTKASNSSIDLEFTHLDLLKESVDFSPYAGNTVQLPTNLYNTGKIIGWERSTGTQAEEPVDMLKFIMDLSLEKVETEVHLNVQRFMFWCDVIMKHYMPILYPKVCISVGFKDEHDKLGFFHHCPGSFQRVMARWLYKLRSNDPCFDALWSKKGYSDVMMETLRQRFAYRDPELVVDAIKFYSQICKGGQYIPTTMRSKMNEMYKSMIYHVSQIFHPSASFDDANILLLGLELCEITSQQKLDMSAFSLLRKSVLAITEATYTVRENPPGSNVLIPMVATVFHVWTNGIHNPNGSSTEIWNDLSTFVIKWITTTASNTTTTFMMELINRWKMELISASRLVISNLHEPMHSTETEEVFAASRGFSTMASSSSSSNDVMQSAPKNTMTVDLAMLLLDRILHVITPSIVLSNIHPGIHFAIQDSIHQVIQVWLENAILLHSNMATNILKQISPSTILALFGKWILPVCQLHTKSKTTPTTTMSKQYELSHYLAIQTLCELCFITCECPITSNHLSILCVTLHQGFMSHNIQLISTIIRHSSNMFTMNLQGIHVLIPSCVYAIQYIVESMQSLSVARQRATTTNSSNTTNTTSSSSQVPIPVETTLASCTAILLSIVSLPVRYPELSFQCWQSKMNQLRSKYTSATSCQFDQLEAVPELDDTLTGLIGSIFVQMITLEDCSTSTSSSINLTTVQQKALWGLYFVISVEITLVPHQQLQQQAYFNQPHEHLKIWIHTICESCSSSDLQLGISALQALYSLSYYHQQLITSEPGVIQHIVMALTLLIQQQIEDASTEVHQHLETVKMNTNTNSKASINNSTSTIQELNDNNGNSTAPNDNSDNIDGPNPSGMKLRQTSTSTSKAIENPILKRISLKTSLIFECLQVYLMQSMDVLKDDAVLQMVFSAIECGLIGNIPQGEWEQYVKMERQKQHNAFVPLLFYGLHMRETLEKEQNTSLLQCFKEIAISAQSLLLHLLHHFHGFPSEAGVDQFDSNCTEYTCSDKYNTFSFVYMESIIFTIMGSMNSNTARIVARDMTGTYTWDSYPLSPIEMDTKAVMKTSDQCVKASLQHQHTNSDHRTNAMTSSDTTNTTSNNTVKRPYQQPWVRNRVQHSIQNSSMTTDTMTTGPVQSTVQLYESSICSYCHLQYPVERKLKYKPLQVIESVSGPVLNSTTHASGNPKYKYNFHEDIKSKTSTTKEDTTTTTTSTMTSNSNSSTSNTNTNSTSSSNNTNIVYCTCTDQERTSGFNSVCGLFTFDDEMKGIGSLDQERCVLDMLIDSIPSQFRDIGHSMAQYDFGSMDKTILGGKYTMDKYNEVDTGLYYRQRIHNDTTRTTEADEQEDSSPSTTIVTRFSNLYHTNSNTTSSNSNEPMEVLDIMDMDTMELEGLSFFQRLIHDDECYSQLKTFLIKDKQKDLIDFCDQMKKFKRCHDSQDRFAQATLIYWEFFSMESLYAFHFPSKIIQAIQQTIQDYQLHATTRTITLVPYKSMDIPMDVFQPALTYIEKQYFDAYGILDRFIASLSDTNTNPTTTSTTSTSTSVLPQLVLYDALSVMECNIRIYKESLLYKMKNGTTGSQKPCMPTNRSRQITGLDIGRLFLSQCGMLPPLKLETTGTSHSPTSRSFNTNRHKIRLLDIGPNDGLKYERNLKHLDKSLPRECMKVGIVYVDMLQHTQQDILKNEHGSQEYDEFLLQLGWKVSLVQHKGFTGGLDCNPKTVSNGNHSIYYSTSNIEIMYHIITYMPTKPNDPQQIDKKRHIGNDFVHIVWNENTKQKYQNATITSNFNFVQIVISPLQDACQGLYLIEILTKSNVPQFGPLLSGMIVCKANLAELVRQTAMNANRVCRQLTAIYLPPYPTRQKLIDEIIERYSTELNEKILLTSLFKTENEKAV